MKTLLNFLFTSLLAVALVGCDSGSPTEPASQFGSDIVQATATSTSFSINEGQRADIQLQFDRATRNRAYVSWEVRNGIGRFLRPTGIILAESGVTPEFSDTVKN